ncbi:hypothetical protein PC119_g21237 [Phytophthora cactorum]|nr:hypothetical protein PC119_g21237 [Phytophthora cactorum]
MATFTHYIDGDRTQDRTRELHYIFCAVEHVEYVGIYDDVAKGCVVYDPTRDSQIEPISPPLRRPPLHRETLKKPTKGKPPAVRISKPVGHEAGSGGAFRMVMEDNEE